MTGADRCGDGAEAACEGTSEAAPATEAGIVAIEGLAGGAEGVTEVSGALAAGDVDSGLKAFAIGEAMCATMTVAATKERILRRLPGTTFGHHFLQMK